VPDPVQREPPDNAPDDEVEPAPIDARAEELFGGAVTRIRHAMLLLGTTGTVISSFIWGWRIGIGVLLGCVLSYVNFNWLERALNSLAERVTEPGSTVSSTGTVFRFLLRYVFIGLGAYVIFRSYPAGLYGFLGGLSLTVAAILCEAVYELSAALRLKI